VNEDKTMATTDHLIRTIDDVELPTPGWWAIAARQPISLRTTGLRRRTMSGTISGGVMFADDPTDSTLELLICPSGADSPEHDLAVHATLTSAGADGTWRFTGSVDGTVTVPIAVDVTYHGVYKRADRATAWLTVQAALPGMGGRPRLVLAGDVNADHPKRGA
jgi:hypothetical protein